MTTEPTDVALTPLPAAPSKIQRILDMLNVEYVEQLRRVSRAAVLAVPYVGEGKADDFMTWRKRVLGAQNAAGGLQAPVPSVAAAARSLDVDGAYREALARLEQYDAVDAIGALTDILPDVFGALGQALVNMAGGSNVTAEARRVGMATKRFLRETTTTLGVARSHLHATCRELIRPDAPGLWRLDIEGDLADDLGATECGLIAMIGMHEARTLREWFPVPYARQSQPREQLHYLTEDWARIRERAKAIVGQLPVLSDADLARIRGAVPAIDAYVRVNAWRRDLDKWHNPRFDADRSISEALYALPDGATVDELRQTLAKKKRPVAVTKIRSWLGEHAVRLGWATYQHPDHVPIPASRRAAVAGVVAEAVRRSTAPYPLESLAALARQHFPAGTGGLLAEHVGWLLADVPDVTVADGYAIPEGWAEATPMEQAILTFVQEWGERAPKKRVALKEIQTYLATEGYGRISVGLIRHALNRCPQVEGKTTRGYRWVPTQS